MKIRTMLIIALACFSLLSMITFTIYTGASINSIADRQYAEMLEELSVKQSHNIEVYFESLKRRLNKIAGNPTILSFVDLLEKNVDSNEQELNGDSRTMENYKAFNALDVYIKDGSGVNGVAIFNDKNEIIVSVGHDARDFILSSKLQRLDEYQVAVYDSGDSLSSDFELIQYAKLSDSYYIACIYNSENIRMFFSRSSFSANGRTILIGPLYNLLDSGAKGNLEEGSISLPEYIGFKKHIITQSFPGGTVAFNYDVGKYKRTALLSQVGDTGWYLGVIGEVDKAFVHSSETLGKMVNCLIITGIIALTLSIVFIIIFTKPLLIIRDTLFKIHRGDHEARITINANNEYGKIAKEFNNLLDNVVVSEGRYRTIIEMSDNIIFEWNFLTNSVYFSNNFNKKFSYRAPTDAYEDSFLLKCKVHPEDTSVYNKTLEKLKKGEAIHQDEFRWKNIYGDYIWVLMRAIAIFGNKDEIIKVVGVIVDIDRAKKSEKILTTRASYDALTGLYNRETVESLINNEIDLISARKNEFAILFIDVDDFKQYNDNYSHATGDQVLKFTAITINDIVSKFGMAGRYGGDEFVVCIRNSDINDPAKVAQEMLDKLKDGFVCDVGDRLSVAVSIGIAIIKDSSKRVDEIIGLADDAMYQIKKSGKSNYGFIN